MKTAALPLSERASRAQKARRNRLAQQSQQQRKQNWFPVQSVQSMPDAFHSSSSSTSHDLHDKPDLTVTSTTSGESQIPDPTRSGRIRTTSNSSRFIDADMMDAFGDPIPMNELRHSQETNNRAALSSPPPPPSEEGILLGIPPVIYPHKEQQQHKKASGGQMDRSLSLNLDMGPSLSSRKSPHKSPQLSPLLPPSSGGSKTIATATTAMTTSSTSTEPLSPRVLDWGKDPSLTVRTDSDTPVGGNPTSPPPPPPPLRMKGIRDDADRGSGHQFTPDSPEDEMQKPSRRKQQKEVAAVSTASMEKLMAGIKQGKKPPSLSKDEEKLWSLVYQTIQHKRSEYMAKKRIMEKKLQETVAEVELNKAEKEEAQKKVQSLEEELHKKREESFKQTQVVRRTQTEARDASRKAKVLQREHFEKKRDFEKNLQEQQEEHEAALLAIQRVLADVTSEKDSMKETLEGEIQKLKERNAELSAKIKKDSSLQDQTEEPQQTKKDLQTELEEKEKDLEESRSGTSCRSEELEQSLKNARLLIASLESSNGKVPVDHRMKLKQKDAEIYKLRADLGSLRKKLNQVGLDFKNLQNEKTQSDQLLESAKKQDEKQKVLTKHLERAIFHLEAVATKPVEEDTADRISTTICNTLVALKMAQTAATMENRDDDGSVASGMSGAEYSISETSVGGLDQRALERHLDAIIQNDRESAAKGLRQELEEKSNSISRLEEELAKRKKENELMANQNRLLLQGKERSENDLNDQILKLKDQQTNNLRALSKKEQELQVLRDSLAVGDEVSYISGDESDNEETGASTSSPNTVTHLSFVSTGVEMSAHPSASEIEAMRQKLIRAEEEKAKAMRNLQEEKESLSNAKMIISSLEKANKTMLEDLRSRLQDSNTAIASLLDKSMENEKISKELRIELEKVKREKNEADEKHKGEMNKIKDEAMVAGLRLAAKDKEIQALRLATSYETIEEKKE